MAELSRTKGTRFERQVCERLSRWFDPSLPENPPVESLTFRRRSTSIMPLEGHWHGAGDILHVPHLEGSWPFCVECKKVEGWTLDSLLSPTVQGLWSWWSQACDQAARVADREPLLIFARNHRPTHVMVWASTQAWLRIEPEHGNLVMARPSESPPVVVCLLDDLVRVPLSNLRSRLRPSSVPCPTRPVSRRKRRG